MLWNRMAALCGLAALVTVAVWAADNITVANSAYTAVLGADDVSSVMYPRSKLVWGVDGAVVDASASNPLPVTVSSQTPGTAAASLGKAEDAAHASGDTGVMLLAVRKDTASALAGTDADYQPIITDSSGRLWVNIGASGSVSILPATSGGCTPYHQVSDNTTLDDNIKGSAGQLYAYTFSNANAAARYIKLYDKATAPSSADTPFMTVLVPAGGSTSWSCESGVVFANGLGVRACTGMTPSDNTAVAANEIAVNIAYK